MIWLFSVKISAFRLFFKKGNKRLAIRLITLYVVSPSAIATRYGANLVACAETEKTTFLGKKKGFMAIWANY